MNEKDTDNKRRVSEDLVGAEYVAGREVAALGGFWLEFFDQLGEIQRQQFDLWVEDTQESVSRLTQATPPAEVFMDHLNRRIGHLVEGSSQVAALWAKEAERSQAVHRRLWDPYLNLLDSDRR